MQPDSAGPTPQSFGPRQLHTLNLIARMSAQALVHHRRGKEQQPLASRDTLMPSCSKMPSCLGLLPRNETLDVAALYLPAAHAALGGDWYDVFLVDDGICLVIGDVVGHGLASPLSWVSSATRSVPMR